MTTSAAPAAQRAADAGSGSGSGAVGPTRLLARWIAGLDDAAIGPATIEWSRHVLLDWIAVTVAGASEPLARMLRDEYADPHADAPCTLPGSGRRARPHDAALINGATGHALDFDDVSARMVGHPTAPVAPAALALGQALGVTGRALLRALVVGHEVEARIGELLGLSHYAHGFHTTGTIGSFGAAAACATLAGLDAATTEQALGLAATQASGLKCMFGTMAKPLHAGRAAMNGVMAVQLAARGFTARDGAIECEQGFARTQAPAAGEFPAAIDTSAGFAIETTLFKYHASCYLTHSTIEAVRLLRERHGLALDDLDALTIAVPRTHRGVCDIVEPRTGLEVKFSIRHLAALALAGVDTASLDLYTDAIALDERYGAARARVSLIDDDGPDRHAARVTIRTRDGRSLAERFDVGVPARDAAAQWQRLVAKARSITMPVIGGQRFEKLVAAITALDSAPTLQPLLEAIA